MQLVPKQFESSQIFYFQEIAQNFLRIQINN